MSDKKAKKLQKCKYFEFMGNELENEKRLFKKSIV